MKPKIQSLIRRPNSCLVNYRIANYPFPEKSQQKINYQISKKLIVVCVSVSDALNLDGLLVFDVEDDVAVLLALLHVLERLLALSSDCDTGCLDVKAKGLEQIRSKMLADNRLDRRVVKPNYLFNVEFVVRLNLI